MTDNYAPPNMLQRTDQVVLQILKSFGEAALKGEGLDRRDIAGRMMSVWRNDLGGLVNEQLMSMFAPENFLDLRLATHTSTNVLERVVRETCLLYSEPASRWLKNDDAAVGASRSTAGGRLGELLSLSDAQLMQEPADAPEDGAEPVVSSAGDTEVADASESEEDPFERWLAASDLDGLWAEVQRLARFHPAVWVKPEVREGEDGQMSVHYDIYTPATADVIASPKDATQALAWFTWREESAERTLATGVVDLFAGARPRTRRVFHLWTRDTYYQLDEKGKDVRPPQPNPIGRLPVVVVRLGMPVGGYYLDGIGGDLYDATIEICCLRTIQNRAYRDTFKQLVISGVLDPEKIPQGQVMGNPALPILIGDEGTASVLAFDPNLQAMSAMVGEREQSIATKYGISPDAWRMSSQAQSGFAKRMDKSEVLKRNREDRKHLATAEADLYRVCALLSVQDGTSGLPGIGQLDPEAPFVVDFAEPRFEEAPTEQARADAQAVQLGIRSVLDLVMRDNPDLTEEEAVRMLALNRALNRRFLDKQGATLLELLAAPAGSGGGGAPPQGVPGA